MQPNISFMPEMSNYGTGPMSSLMKCVMKIQGLCVSIIFRVILKPKSELIPKFIVLSRPIE